MGTVDWSVYARDYDAVASLNPAYQELLHHCISTVKNWRLPPGSVIADFGAGTGNFSITLAQTLRHLTVLHVDCDEEMIRIAQRKADAAEIVNWRVVQMDLATEDWTLPQLAGIVTVHCLYSVADPHLVIHRICRSLADRGFVYACDIGRALDIGDWTRFLLRDCLRNHGLKATLDVALRFRRIRRHNRAVARSQMNGTYWTHDLGEFRSAFETAGICIQSASDGWYRGYDDMVIGWKPPTPLVPQNSAMSLPRHTMGAG